VVTPKDGRLSAAAEALRDLLIEEIRANLTRKSI
jgi:hypothetical protein